MRAFKPIGRIDRNRHGATFSTVTRLKGRSNTRQQSPIEAVEILSKILNNSAQRPFQPRNLYSLNSAQSATSKRSVTDTLLGSIEVAQCLNTSSLPCRFPPPGIASLPCHRRGTSGGVHDRRALRSFGAGGIVPGFGGHPARRPPVASLCSLSLVRFVWRHRAESCDGFLPSR